MESSASEAFESSRVEVIQGDVFAHKADLLVVPRSTTGIMSDPFHYGIRRLGVPYERITSELGTVELEREFKVENFRQLAYATSNEDGTTNLQAIQAIGQALAQLAREYRCQTIASPLLGTGSRSIDPVDAFEALQNGFLTESQGGITLQIVVNDQAYYQKITDGSEAPREVPAPFELTKTVKLMIEQFAKQDACLSADLVLTILARRPEYGKRIAQLVITELRGRGADFAQRSINAWLAELTFLFDRQKMSLLRGRLVVLGLCVIDDALRRQLIPSGFLKEVLGELEKDFGSLLSPEGLSKYSEIYPEVIKSPFDKEAFLTILEKKPSEAMFTVSKMLNNDIWAEMERKPREAVPQFIKMLNNDIWAEKDQLGYELYATAISEMIREESNQTKPPLTIAILAPWGQGKTTLMHYVERNFTKIREGLTTQEAKLSAQKEKHNWSIPRQKILRLLVAVKRFFQKRSPGQVGKQRRVGKLAKVEDVLKWIKKPRFSPHPIHFPTVWFNPWKHQNTEQVWAGLAYTLITSLVEHLPRQEQEKFWFQLNLKRININTVKNRIYKNIVNEFIASFSIGTILLSITLFIGTVYFFISRSTGLLAPLWNGLVTTFPAFASRLGSSFTPTWKAVVAAFSLFGLSAPSVVNFFISRRKVLKDSLKDTFADVVTEPDYEKKSGYFHEVEKDMKRVFDLLVTTDKPAVIFIDDLDRCSPDIIVEVIEAINLIINSNFAPKCYFVIGMDAKMVAASLDKKYSGLVEKFGEEKKRFGDIGYYFLDKFIQLPFVLPVLSNDSRLDLLNTLFTKRASNAPVSTDKALNPEEKDIIDAFSLDKGNLEKREKAEPLIQQKDSAKIRYIENQVRDSLHDSDEIMSQLCEFAPYLGSSPRSIKRFVNMFRFYYAYQDLRKIQKKPFASPSALAKWLVLSVRCPQLVRFIQWETEEKLIDTSDPVKKAAHLDALIEDFKKENALNGIKEVNSDKTKSWRAKVDELKIEDFGWLKEHDVLSILLIYDQKESSLANAIGCNIW